MAALPPGNHSGHCRHWCDAICAMTRAMRAQQGTVGLLYGNGEYVSKHDAAIISMEPMPSRPSVQRRALQPALDAARGPVPCLLKDCAGVSGIETYTAMYDRGGEPEFANIVACAGDAAEAEAAAPRHLARVTRGEQHGLRVTTDIIDRTPEETGAAGFVGWRSITAPSFTFRSTPVVGDNSTTAGYVFKTALGQMCRSSGAVGEVVARPHPQWQRGTLVATAHTRWQFYQKFAPDNEGFKARLDPAHGPLDVHLGALGLVGFTACIGMLDIGRPQSGQTVLVSAAAGLWRARRTVRK